MFFGRVAFPIQAESTPVVDLEKALPSSQGGEHEKSISSLNDDCLDNTKKDDTPRDELEEMRRKYDNMKVEVQRQNDEMNAMRRQNQDLERYLPEDQW